MEAEQEKVPEAALPPPVPDVAETESPEAAVVDTSTTSAEGSHRHSKEAETAQKIFEKMISADTTCDCKLVSDKEDITVFTGIAPDGNEKALTAKSLTRIKASPRVVFEVLNNDAYRFQVDSMLKSATVVEELDFRTRVAHFVYKGVWPVSSRDFVLLSSWYIKDDGAIYIVTNSIEHAKLPPTKSSIRASMLTAGYKLRPHKSADGKIFTDVEFASCTDMGGGLMKAVRTMANKMKTHSTIKGLKEICETLPDNILDMYAKFDSFEEQWKAKKATANPTGKEVPIMSKKSGWFS